MYDRKVFLLQVPLCKTVMMQAKDPVVLLRIWEIISKCVILEKIL